MGAGGRSVNAVEKVRIATNRVATISSNDLFDILMPRL
jgi:hypothetical protein